MKQCTIESRRYCCRICRRKKVEGEYKVFAVPKSLRLSSHRVQQQLSHLHDPRDRSSFLLCASSAPSSRQFSPRTQEGGGGKGPTTVSSSSKDRRTARLGENTRGGGGMGKKKIADFCSKNLQAMQYAPKNNHMVILVPFRLRQKKVLSLQHSLFP